MHQRHLVRGPAAGSLQNQLSMFIVMETACILTHRTYTEYEYIYIASLVTLYSPAPVGMEMLQVNLLFTE